MNLVGYLVTMANLQSFGSGNQPTDMSIRVGPLQDLADEISSLPGFPLNGFKQGYQRQGNLGKFMSKNLQNYMYYGIGDPKSEGLILTLHYADKSDYIEKPAEKGRAYFVHGPNVSDDIKKAVNTYLGKEQWRTTT